MSDYTAVEAEEATRRAQGVTELIENLGKPVIAAVNGFALGGGCELAMACTFRSASEGAKFGQPEVKVGVLPGAGGNPASSAIDQVKGRALQLILTGETVNAEEAYRTGLVNEVLSECLSNPASRNHSHSVSTPTRHSASRGSQSMRSTEGWTRASPKAC